jgi:DNA repair exonuclease SbcCD ATPase subunit/predicted MPP superfamily phosphohydrolase
MKIKVPFKKLERIAHLADVHIRLYKRHDEYKECFAKLYEQIKTSDLTSGVIVVAGDIVHAKTDMSPEMVALASEFFKSLADIAPTLVIAGNHDFNMANANRLDSLSPIIELINHPNLHYLRDSGIYKVADTDFAVFSIVDGKDKWPGVKDCTAKNKIALYHGPVYGANTGTNFTVTSRHVEAQAFDGFDAVLLGDIHTYQILQQRDIKEKKPIIVYSSSLIQQNHGELLNNHGWCLWEVANFAHKFIELPNDYGFYTFECTDNAKLPVLPIKNVRLRIFTGDVDSVSVKKLIAAFKKNYNVVELTTNKHRYDGIIKPKTAKHTELLDVTNVNIQNSLITEYLNNASADIDDKIVEEILQINSNANNQLKHGDYSRSIQWRPIEFNFSNMFSYGENNKITFDNMKGVYGIFAPNASGKSSIMDALMFCLYDKTPRASRAGHVMNNRKNTFDCQLTLQISNTIYVIKKRGTRKKGNEVKVDVEFLRQELDGTFVALTGQERRDTNSIIRSYIGTYEDFILTTFTNNMSGALFIDTSHSERKDLLSQFMGLNIFDKLHEIANEESKQLAAIIKKFNKTDISDKLVSVQNAIEKLQMEETTVIKKLDYIKSILSDSEVTKSLLLRDLLPLAKDLEDPDLLNTKKAKYETQIQSNLTETDALKDKLVKLIDLENKLIQSTEAVDFDELQKTIASMQAIQNKITQLQNKKKQLSVSIIETERLISKLSDIKYNKECDICIQNNITFIDELSESKTKLEDLSAQIMTIDLEVEALAPKIQNMDVMTDAFNEYTTNLNKLTRIDAEKTKVSSSIDSLNSFIQLLYKNIEDVDFMIQEYNNNLDAISHNKQIESKLVIAEYDISSNKKQIDKIQSTILDVSSELKVAKNIKSTMLTEMSEMEETERKFNIYKHYLQATGRDGIPRMLLSKVVPTIQNEINTILSQLVGFTITLEMEGKNINAYLNYDHERVWPLENCSGMERFISGIAMRVALLNASNLPKSNFLLIDEGFGTLDSDHLSSMQTLFSLLKSQFEFILIVSHLDTARDMVDNSLEIRHKDGYSYINI